MNQKVEVVEGGLVRFKQPDAGELEVNRTAQFVDRLARGDVRATVLRKGNTGSCAVLLPPGFSAPHITQPYFKDEKCHLLDVSEERLVPVV